MSVEIQDITINFIFNLAISKMTTPAKITFGNNAATSYTINTNPNFAYQSGDNIASSYSPYNLGNTGQNVVTTSSYSAYEAPREVSYGGNYRTQPYQASFSSGQVMNPVGVSYESGRNVTYASPAAKVTFGSKSYTPTYAPTTSTYTGNYQYTAPAPVQYQTYQTYQQPVEITSQPIRTQVREEVIVEPPKVETVPEVRRSQVTGTVPEPVKESKAKKQKSGCPKWLWPLLGILALLALIIGLLFGLGVFGRIGKGGVPAIAGQSSSTVTGGKTDTTTGGPVTGTTISTTTTTGSTTATTTGDATTTGGVSGSSTGGSSTGGSNTGVTTPTGYTLIEETIVSTKDNKTSITGVTSPTVTGPTVTTPTLTGPTVTVPTVTTPTVTVPTTSTTDDDQFTIDPTAVSPEVVPITSYTTQVPSTTTTWSTTGTTGPSSIWSNTNTGSGNTVTGTTYPTGTYSGYGSNPVLNSSMPRSSSWDSSLTPASFDYVLPTSAY